MEKMSECKYCKINITWDENHLSDRGTKIPMNDDGTDHHCPVLAQKSQQPQKPKESKQTTFPKSSDVITIDKLKDNIIVETGNLKVMMDVIAGLAEDRATRSYKDFADFDSKQKSIVMMHWEKCIIEILKMQNQL